ncbi:MAG TPA: GIY-YIG nuclease family protein, partial [Umezawaea sp.]|nr:GIY-YIG nuclease family protein [Umezawaea sp.]
SDYLVKVEAEKEQARAERERLREEAKVSKEIERERARLAKERTHYTTIVARLEAKGDLEGLERAREQLASVDSAIAGVEQRAANVRAGYVYVISNIGAFGPDVVKIGMTRRLEPMDRVRELGDASVPFRFDTHALFFSEDAVALENSLHHKLSHRRLNLVNPRREFFYATPAEVRDLLVSLGNDHVLEFNDIAEAVEWRASDPGRRGGSGTVGTQLDADGDLSDDGGE